MIRSGVNIIDEQKRRTREENQQVFIINIPSNIQFRPV